MVIIIKIRELVLKRIIQFYSPLTSARTLITGQLCAAVESEALGDFTAIFSTSSKGNWQRCSTENPQGLKFWRFRGGL